MEKKCAGNNSLRVTGKMKTETVRVSLVDPRNVVQFRQRKTFDKKKVDLVHFPSSSSRKVLYFLHNRRFDLKFRDVVWFVVQWKGKGSSALNSR